MRRRTRDARLQVALHFASPISRFLLSPPSTFSQVSAAAAISINKAPTMAEPDDLYTLRAQFWLGHYDMVRLSATCSVGAR